MCRYKVRVHRLTLAGFFTQADHYEDFEFESSEPIETFAARLASKGFADPDDATRWIMPGAILSIEQLDV